MGFPVGEVSECVIMTVCQGDGETAYYLICRLSKESFWISRHSINRECIWEMWARVVGTEFESTIDSDVR